jgi:4-hydroxyphenylpyruvate dioxygenase
MLHSIATVSLSGTLEEKIAAIAGAGFDGIELFENDLTVYPGSPRDARSLIEGHGLRLIALQPFRDFEGLGKGLRQRAMDRAERKFDVMAELGTDLLLVCSSVHPAARGGIDRCASDFHELGERAAKRGVRVAYEALAWGRYVNDYRDAWEIVRRAGHPHIGLVLDTFHLFSRGSPVQPIQAIPGDRILLVQMADAPRLSMDHLSWSRHYRCFPGQGELPIDEFMFSLEQTGYDGPLSQEIFNDAFRAIPPEQTARDGKRSLNFVMDVAAAHVANRLPPRARPVAVDFVEFTGDDERLDQLAMLLRALGFAHVGQHVQKRVQRWMQGDVNLLLNYEPHSFASAFHEAHGTAVCAYAMRVIDVKSAVRRARGLGLELQSPRAGVDTHGMEALKSVDGSLVYLVDAAESPGIWRREFQKVEPAPAQPRISQIDHISISVLTEQLLSELLQYRAMFAMEPAPQFDIADLRGLVHSQALQTAEREVSVVLNSSEARGTLTGEFLQRFRGAGIQHIALRCDDIFAVAHAAMEAGMSLLTIPRNYYADLQARFGFTDAEISRLQQHHLLYDEDGQGRFWQFYGALVDGRFFFEAVQRDRYEGFGAPNAFVRAAAQRTVSLAARAGESA